MLRALPSQPDDTSVFRDLHPSIDLLLIHVGILDRDINAVDDLLGASIFQFEINVLSVDLVGQSIDRGLIRIQSPVQARHIVSRRLMRLLNLGDLIRLPNIFLLHAGKLLPNTRQFIL